MVAGGGLFLLTGEGQGKANQRVYTASGDTKQAALIFSAMSEMIRNDPALDSRFVIYDGYRRIEYPAGNSTLEVLSSVPKSKHGLGPTAVLIDEYHVVDEELVNVLTTGFAARLDPLTWMITTAGWDRHSLCFDEWQYAVDVRDGVREDPTYLPVIHAAGAGDDWTDEATWHKAMPALGDFCSLDFIREEFHKARERPRFENTFRQLYLNQWTEQAERWLSLDAWDRCTAEVDWSAFEGRACYAGLDMSTIHDLTALVLVFPGEAEGDPIVVLPFFWVPGESAIERERRDRVPYPAWKREGHVTFTDAETLDHERVASEIEAIAQRFPIQALAFDPAHAGYVATRLDRDGAGLTMLPFKQTHFWMNAPAKRLEGLIIDGNLRHDGQPVLRWCVANAAIDQREELIRPSKGKSTERIDGVVALVMALGAWMGEGGDERSVYEERGPLVL
ncbi:Phage Terminase [Tautonia plasticadhaerens]|uniref:Phage Terminase n=1 Tax=Tautonia plasticadhaerens TaxID=2527974 RepID=A0A518GZK8_9BACT|nr:Phage Terminase [Tautonia plasticadhaerens]